MNKDSYILITGAAGFIGSYMVGYLNKKGYENLILADEFPARPAGRDDEEKELNLHGKKYRVRVERENLFEWLEPGDHKIDFVFHLGARTDTTEFDYSILEKLNVIYSQKIWNYCTLRKIPLVYASSAATYGDGALGYKDDHSIIEKLKPLNAYGISKNEFDKWVLRQAQDDNIIECPPFWAGLKFFNVYGPNEYHKGRMASVVLHAFNQIQSTGKVKLFRSHNPVYKDGGQLRDFIYVEDIAAVCYWMMEEKGRMSEVRNQASDFQLLSSGIYNLGTGKARTFIDLVMPIFNTLDIKSSIEFIDTPEDIRDKYQYFTEADMTKLISAGYQKNFYSLEDGVEDYVKNFLKEKKFY